MPHNKFHYNYLLLAYAKLKKFTYPSRIIFKNKLEIFIFSFIDSSKYNFLNFKILFKFNSLLYHEMIQNKI